MDLEQLRQILNKLSPNEEAVNKLINLLGTFFSEKEVLLKLEGKEELAKGLIAFVSKHKDLPVLLDYINSRIKDKQISKTIKTITRVIKHIFGALEKYDNNTARVFQQRLAQLIMALTKELETVHKRRTLLPVKEYCVEASSYFRKQRDTSKIFDSKDIIERIERIKKLATAGKVPCIPQAAEPRCYGGAPNHLNSIVIGSARRLVFYIHPDETGNTIRLCAYIDAKTHNDAINTLHERPGNIYWLIIRRRINRLYFKDFKRINPETLEDLWN